MPGNGGSHDANTGLPSPRGPQEYPASPWTGSTRIPYEGLRSALDQERPRAFLYRLVILIPDRHIEDDETTAKT